MDLRCSFLLVIIWLITWSDVSISATNSQARHNNYVILNNAVTANELTKQQLRSVFMGQQTLWPDGTKIVLFVYPSSNIKHKNFVKLALGLYPYQFTRRWQKLVFSGFGVKPTIVASKEEMLRKVATTTGAIGYIDEAITQPGVKYATQL